MSVSSIWPGLPYLGADEPAQCRPHPRPGTPGTGSSSRLPSGRPQRLSLSRSSDIPMAFPTHLSAPGSAELQFNRNSSGMTSFSVGTLLRRDITRRVRKRYRSISNKIIPLNSVLYGITGKRSAPFRPKGTGGKRELV